MRVAILAGIALCVRLTIVVFVVGALVVGNLRAWRWVNRLGFRLAHLSAIGVVVAEAW